MKMPAIVLLLAVWIFPAYKTAYSLSVLITPPEELVRNSDVIVTAKLRSVSKQAKRCVARFTVEESLKGGFHETSLTAAFPGGDLEKPCKNMSVVSGLNDNMNFDKDIGSIYLLFLKKMNGGEEFDIFPSFYKISSPTTVDNIERLVAIETAQDEDERKALYLEILQSGEERFFMDVCNELIKLNAHTSILEKTLFDRWKSFSGEQWKQSELIAPLVALKSQAAIPLLKEIAWDSDSHWLFRYKAMEALIQLKADHWDDFLLEIYLTDPDVWSLSWSTLNRSEKNAGDFLFKAISDERNKDNPRMRAEFLMLLVEMDYPSVYDLAMEFLASKYLWEKHAAYAAFIRLRDVRAYPVLVRDFDSITVLKSSLMKAMIAIDDENTSRFLTSRLDATALSDVKNTFDIVDALGNSNSPVSFEKLSQRLAAEIDRNKTFKNNPSAPGSSLISTLIRSLIRIDPVKAKELVLPLVKNPNLLVSRMTISTLGNRKASWAFESLREKLSDRCVADDAADALLKINYEKAYPVIQQHLKSGKLLLTPRLKESILQFGNAEHRHRLMVLESELRGKNPATKYALEVNLRLNTPSAETLRVIFQLY